MRIQNEKGVFMKKMMMMLTTGLFAVSFSGQLSLADNHEKGEHKAQMEAQRNAVESACSAEATATGCAGKEVGKGLLKCMHEYKKANKDFKFSDGCKEATKDLKHERKEHRKHKKEAEEKK